MSCIYDNSVNFPFNLCNITFMLDSQVALNWIFSFNDYFSSVAPSLDAQIPDVRIDPLRYIYIFF